MTFIDFVGFLAALTSTLSLVPQILKTYQRKSAQDLSYLMLLNFLVTSFLWIYYGLMIESMAVWGGNFIMLIFSLILLIFKSRYGKN